MTRYLITFINGFHEFRAELIDERKLEVRPDATVEELIAAWRKPIEYRSCKGWGLPFEFLYSRTERSDDEAYIVYRESDAGDFVYAGAVRPEMVRPALTYDELYSSEESSAES